MIHAVKLVRTHPPSPPLFSSPLQSHIGRKTSSVRFILATSDDIQPEITDKDKTPAKKTGGTDAMSESFGEDYATRSDGEGFGGIYGGNQHPSPDEDEVPGENDHVEEFDKSQGSEAKEKEKTPHQPTVAA